MLFVRTLNFCLLSETRSNWKILNRNIGGYFCVLRSNSWLWSAVFLLSQIRHQIQTLTTQLYLSPVHPHVLRSESESFVIFKYKSHKSTSPASVSFHLQKQFNSLIVSVCIQLKIIPGNRFVYYGRAHFTSARTTIC